MIGESISHYIILEKIGEGGMGVVYKAEDTKLKRTVALKFLPSELTRDPQAKARFVQEAQAAAALDHPHICAVFEIGEAEGATYIAMPYVKGQSLKEKIAAGPLSMEEALDIAGQVAEGLKEAHERGIIHRDIKPANIMLTEKGQAKIMDFGLAKLEEGVDLTKTMAVLGTVAYMSPEQARGEEVDHRTDIWSFGATLYEMLTGQKPFGQKHDQALLYSILNDTTESVSRIRPEIPKHLDRVIQKALEKDRPRRYQNMAEILEALRAVRTSGMSIPQPEKSIIVLPFENLSPDPENAFFTDGLTEEVIAELSQIAGLRVISRTTSMKLKGSNKDVKEISRELNVRYAVEGSVRKAGDSLRITAQLIDIITDTHLWADRYSGTVGNVFEFQERLARDIAQKLRVSLSPEDERRIGRRRIADPVAYGCYLRANQERLRHTQEAIDNAVGLLKKALQIEGPNELLLATLGVAYLHYWDVAIRPEESLLREAETCAKRILEMNPNSPEGYALRGAILSYRRQMQAAVRQLKKALLINPNSADALRYLTAIAGLSGHMEASRSYYMKLSAVNPWNDFNPGWFECYSGRFEAAVDGYRKEYEMDPQSSYGRWAYGIVLAWARHTNEACQILEQLVKDSPSSNFGRFGALFLNALQGRVDKALEVMSPEFIAAAKNDVQFSWMVGSCYALLGKAEDAIDWIEHAVKLGFIHYPFLNEYDSWLANIRGEPRFKKLMERVKYEWEHFEV
jgi:serine/threonine protein kinase